MASNITDLNKFKKVADDKKQGEDLVNAFISASNTSFETRVLGAALKNSPNIMFFAGEELRLTEGTTRRASNEQLLHASESQLYKVEVVEQLKVLKLRFPDGELYVVSLDQSTSDEDLKNLAMELDNESQRNQLIQRQNFKSLGMPKTDLLPWENKEDFKTEGLEMVLGAAEKVSIGIFNDDGPQFTNVKNSDIINIAKEHTMTSSVNVDLKKINIHFSDDDQTFISLNMKEHLPNELIKQCADVLSSESSVNRSYRQNNDPNIARAIAQANSVKIEMSDDELEYMDNVLGRNKPEIKNDDENNVVSLRPR